MAVTGGYRAKSCGQNDTNGPGNDCPGGKGHSGRRRGRMILYISIWGIMLALHAMAWSSKGFCDWYLTCVYGIWVNTYGRAMGMIPFSVGEALIGLGAGFGAAGILLGAVRLTDKAAERYGRAAERRGRVKTAYGNGWKRAYLTEAGRRKKLAGAYCATAMWLLLGVFALMTLNCYILYHASGFGEMYLGTASGEYGLEELEALRNFVVEQCNVLCCQLPREESGVLSCQGNIGDMADMAETAKGAMRQLGATYSLLDGFYPDPKPLRSSDFMSQQHVAGCFYPFSMEANYNNVMYVMNLPSTLCHELAHLKGFIREDEANLIGYLACVQSEDIYFRYSGYLSVLYYIDNDYREAAGYERYLAAPGILPQVHRDNIFLTPKERDRIQETALLSTETVDAVSDQVADVRLKLNGVAEGMVSYSRVVELLLRYYDVNGYPGDCGSSK